MLSTAQRLQPRTAEVASKVMDGEAIIINLANGVYYSLADAGGFIWEQITSARTVEETAVAVAARYDVSRERALDDVLHLVEELITEGLVAPFDEGAPVTAEAPIANGVRIPYITATLHIYRDMGDLLALDPPTPGLDTPWQDPETLGP